MAVAAMSLALAACGGADDDAASAPPAAGPLATVAPAQPGAADVSVEGCVAAGVFTPRQAAVRAESADGRLVGTSRTNADGVFVLRVPANSRVRVSVPEPDGYSIELDVGTQPVVLGACLRVGAATGA